MRTMSVSSEARAALELLREVQVKVRATENLRGNRQVSSDLNTLISVLENPVFQSILNIQDSLRELKRQVQLHPSILPADFDITPSGELVLNLPTATTKTTHQDGGAAFRKDHHHSSPKDFATVDVSAAESEVEMNNKSGLVDETFRRVVELAAQGRQLKYIRLHKPEGMSLGFSVVGLKSEHKGELGIYVQEIQPHGIAGIDGQLKEGDQILAIDGQPLDSHISHQQAINILQRARGNVDLAVARNFFEDDEELDNQQQQLPDHRQFVEGPGNNETTTVRAAARESLETSTMGSEWCQVEEIELVNNGSGLGFGIIGGQQAGVIVKTILPEGVADKDGRLRPNDFILQINEHWLHGVGSGRVAVVLRGTGNHVRLVVARPVDPSDTATLRPGLPILPVSVLEDRGELEAHLAQGRLQADNEGHVLNDDDASSLLETFQQQQQEGIEDGNVPEMVTIEVELVKDAQGLGVTIAGYTCEREELSGIFVKSVTEGSSAHRSGKVAVNDQIIEVDGTSIQGFTNQQAVEVLRSTGKTVRLRLIRYVHGFKFEQLQQAIANSQMQQKPAAAAAAPPEEQAPPPVVIRTDSVMSSEDNSSRVVEEDDDDERGLIKYWSEVMGQQYDIVVAQLTKFKPTGGLGISLEGTVEKVDGEEQNPHHYIRSVLPNGPVGQNGRLRSGDELLEVNGKKLLGLYHTDVVAILKDLPMSVRLVCARSNQTPTQTDFPDTFAGSSERLLHKAKSDGSLASSSGGTATTENASQISSSRPNKQQQNESKLKSRSMEPLTSLAMWSEEVQMIELVKGDRGLGFSILDYQDPMNKDETVVVIRSLVPGGVAQQDGRLIPGDRLMFVNEINLGHASLDEAVQALKGANRGIVKIGVSKPLPVVADSESSSGNGSPPQGDNDEDDDDDEGPTTQSERSRKENNNLSTAEEDNTEVRSSEDVSEMESDAAAAAAAAASATALNAAAIKSTASKKVPDDEDDDDDLPPPPLPTSPVPLEAGDDNGEHNPGRNNVVVRQPPAPERLIGGSSSTLVTTRYEEKSEDEDLIPPLPVELERSIKVIKDSDTLGVQVDIEERGVNGLVVRSVAAHGTVGRDGRIQPGDYMVRVKNECLRRTSHSQALDILRRTQMVPKGDEIPITYIPASDAAVYRASAITKLAATSSTSVPTSSSSSSSSMSPGIAKTAVVPPTPAARSSNGSLAKKATTVISIGPETTTAELVVPPSSYVAAAPLVSPEISEDRSAEDVQVATKKAAATRVFLASATVDESTTDDGVLDPDEDDDVDDDDCEPPSTGDPPLPRSSATTPTVPPRPSKSLAASITSSSEHLSCGSKTPVVVVEDDHFSPPPPLLSTEADEDEGIATTSTPTHFVGRQHWGPERAVHIVRQPGQGLGISIVGGKFELASRRGQSSSDSGDGDSGSHKEVTTGIFIKNVLEGSPAGLAGGLSPGDRILEVDGLDLRGASHDKAVEMIRRSGDVVDFVVQSLVAPEDDEVNEDDDELPDAGDGAAEEHQSVLSAKNMDLSSLPPPPFLEKGDADADDGLDDDGSEEEDSGPQRPEEDDDDQEEGQVTLANGLIIDKASAANLPKQTGDPEPEDDFGYTRMKVLKKYGCSGGRNDRHQEEPMVVSLNKGTNGFGISLAGHKDRSRMAVYICGLNPMGNAARCGDMRRGDLLLEVNGVVLHNRHHLNASAIIKNLPDSDDVTFVLMRKPSGLDEVAVRPITQFPPEPFKDNPIERYQGHRYQNLREVSLQKGDSGWGIMILEGKHLTAGTGVFISDLQEGSCAEKAGLLRGDMILAVNGEDFVGVNYEAAARILKTLEGTISMIVANASVIVDNAQPPSSDNTHKLEVDDVRQQPTLSSASGSPEKPKLPPKPALAPKPAAAVTASSTLVDEDHPVIQAMQPSQEKPSAPVTIPKSPVISTLAVPSAKGARKPAPPTSPRGSKDNRDPATNPATCEIVPGADTSIEITKDKDEDGKPMGLGLSIVGGSDTLLGAIFIHEVYEKGAAHKDGRLRPGDQILEVMAENLRNVTHSHALHALRQTPNRVRLVIHREDDEIYETLEVELLKKKDRGLGLSIVGKKSGPGVFISEVVKGGAADADGRLVQGDQILSVNGNDLTNSSQEEAAPILKMAQGRIIMQVRRLRVGNRRHQQQIQQSRDKDSNKDGGTAVTAASGTAVPASAAPSGPNTVPSVVELKRGEQGLGFSIVGGFGSPHGDMPVYVKTVFDTGAASEHGGLKRGDQILTVNGKSLEGLTHQEAVNILKSCEGTVTLHILS